MDINGNDGRVMIKPIGEAESVKDEVVTGKVEGDESESLLPAVVERNGENVIRNGGMGIKGKRKVQWNDNVGNKLAEVLEYQPSDRSDSDDERSDACLCKVM